MKRTQRIELFRSIKKRMVSFIAIMLFVTLGVGVFLGIGWAGEAMAANADDVFSEQRMYDLQLLYPYGFDEKCVEKLALVEGADTVEGVYTAYQFCERNGQRYYARLGQLPEGLNVPYFVEGVLPVREDEIAVEASWAGNVGVKVGDVIRFTHDDDGTAYYLRSVLENDTEGLLSPREKDCGMKHLNTDCFTVTALMESPDFIINSPVSYGSSAETSIAVDCLMFLPECAFDADSYTGYPAVLIRSEALDAAATGSGEYAAAVGELCDRVLAAANPLAEEKAALVSEHADGVLADFEAELAEAARQLEDGEKQLADGKKELAEAEGEIRKGEEELEEAQQQVDYGWVRVERARKKLDSARKEFEPKLRELGEAEAQLNDAQEAYDLASIRCEEARMGVNRLGALGSASPDAAAAGLNAMIADGTLLTLKVYTDALADQYPTLARDYGDFYLKAMSGYYDEHPESLPGDAARISGEFAAVLTDAEAALAAAKKELDEKEAELAAARAEAEPAAKEIERSQNEIDDSVSLLCAMQRKIDDGRKELEEATALAEEKKPEIAEAEERLARGREEYRESEKRLEKGRISCGDLCRDYSCGILSRNQNAGYGAVMALSDVLSNLRFTLAGLFLLVGMFVCYTALSRLVNDQVIQIGTKKALGLTEKEITLSFLAFSGMAAVGGIAAGLLLGTFPVEHFLTKAMAGSFNFKNITTYFSLRDALTVSALELLMILLTTWLSCRRILRERAIRLLSGAQSSGGRQHAYERTKLWKKLPLLTRTIVGNCVNDSRRVFATLVGVAGCTALIVSIFTMTENLGSGLDRQFTELQSFDTILYTDGLSESVHNLKSALAEDGRDSTIAYVQGGAGRFPDGSTGSVVLYAVTEDNAEDFIRLSGRSDPNPQPLTDGVWVSRAYENTFHAKSGDEFRFVNSIGEEQVMEIAGFFDCFLTNEELIMNAATYERVFGAPVRPNALLMNAGGSTKAELEQRYGSVEGFAAAYDFYASSVLAFDTLRTVSAALKAVYVVLSVLMAVLVLLNILVMFVEEKKKELIVLMINGYGQKDARRYIYSDTIVLTVIGILIGVAVGTLMGMLSVTSFESSRTYVAKSPDAAACLIGAAGTAVLTFFMSCIALSRIRRFKLTDLKD